MRALRVWWLKRRARGISRQIHAMYEYFSCGAELIDMVSGGKLTRLKTELAKTMKELKRIDPNYPK